MTDPEQQFIWANRDSPGVKGIPTESVMGIHALSGELTTTAITVAPAEALLIQQDLLEAECTLRLT